VVQTLSLFLTQAIEQVAGQVRSFLQREDGQDAFEYMLIVGGVSVAVIAAVVVIATQSPTLRTLTCNAIASIGGASGPYAGFSC
jgi:Flp pilus assembly pilin Flp